MQNIIIISEDSNLIHTLRRNLGGFYALAFFRPAVSLIDLLYKATPDLMIIDIAPKKERLLKMLYNLKSDPVFSQIPILGIFDHGVETSRWNDLLVEDYLRKSDLSRDLLLRTSLCIARSKRCVEINPLTRLPGNISINRQIQSGLDAREVFALAYLDIDHFKPFNDKYGFSRGDDIINVTGRVVLNIIKNQQPQGSFIGHIGGDDFVYIMDAELIEEASREIIDAFDKIIPSFYDDCDKERGFILSQNRQGDKISFPIMTISIGITSNRFINFSHYGEIAEAATRMKNYAKKFKGSCLRACKRRN